MVCIKNIALNNFEVPIIKTIPVEEKIFNIVIGLRMFNLYNRQIHLLQNYFKLVLSVCEINTGPMNHDSPCLLFSHRTLLVTGNTQLL